MDHVLMHTTKEGVKILVSKGQKKESPFDFRVHYQEPDKRVRTPKHIHIIIDLYMKLSRNKELTLKLVDYLIAMMKKLKPENKFPPSLQVYDKKELAQFEELNKYGQYSAEFILVTTELIMTILSYGKEVKVIQPQTLKDKIKATVQEMAAQYK